MKTHLRLALLSVLALAACEGVTASEQALQGTWRADEHLHESGIVGPSDAYAQLTFGPGDSYTAEYLAYGGNARGADVLTYHYRVDGEYRLRGDSLDVRLFREVSTDVQYPNTNYVHILDGKWQRAGTVAVDGDRLTRRYLTAPTDVPELTISTYTRLKD